MDNNNLTKVETSAAQVNEMVKDILSDSLVEIDNYITVVRQCFLSEQEILDSDLDRIILQIPVYIYNLIVLAQQIEMRKGLSKEHASYAKNEALLNATGTVAEKTAKAENQTVTDKIVMLAYTTANSIISSKIDGAMAILDSAKKVQQKRMKEKQLTATAGNAVGAF